MGGVMAAMGVQVLHIIHPAYKTYHLLAFI